MSKLKNLTKLFNNNRFLFFFSLALSIVIWFAVSIVYSPETGRTISQIPVEITFSDQEAGYQIYSDTELVASVSVSGKKYEVDRLGNDSFVVGAQVTSVKSGGMYTLDLTARERNTSGDFDIISISPSTVNVMIDVERNTQFDVTVNCRGATIRPLEQETESLVLVPTFADAKHATVMVSGPDSEVRQIARVEAVVDVNKELTETEHFEARIVAYDSSGIAIYDSHSRLSKLHYTKFSYDTAEVVANVNMRKTVPIVYNVIGGADKTPPITLRQVIGNETINNTTVNTISIQGAVDVVDQMDTLVLDGVVDLSKIQLGNEETYRFELKLPNITGVTYDEYDNLAELSQVSMVAIVNLDGYAKQTISVDEGRVRVQNIPEGFRAKVNQTQQLITVLGPRASVSQLDSDDITLTVNATGVNAGTTTLVPVVTVDGSSSCWVVGSYNVSLDVVKK